MTFIELGRLQNDRKLRNRLFVPEVYAHPAKLHLGLLFALIMRYTQPGDTILDPMAGSGSLLLAAAHQRNVILRELQPEYVAMIEASVPRARDYAGMFCGSIDVACADARTLDVQGVDHIIFSPPYGFETTSPDKARRRMAAINHPNLGTLSGPSFAAGFGYAGGAGNIGNKSGAAYWREMRLVYARLADLLPAGGLMIAVLKNHYRRGELINVVSQTITEVAPFGLMLQARHLRHIAQLSHWARLRVEAGLPIVRYEDVLVFQKTEVRHGN